MLQLREQYVIDAKGKKTAVLIPLEQYEMLLEDLHDLAIVVERREEETVSFDEIKFKRSAEKDLRHLDR